MTEFMLWVGVLAALVVVPLAACLMHGKARDPAALLRRREAQGAATSAALGAGMLWIAGGIAFVVLLTLRLLAGSLL